MQPGKATGQQRRPYTTQRYCPTLRRPLSSIPYMKANPTPKPGHWRAGLLNWTNVWSNQRAPCAGSRPDLADDIHRSRDGNAPVRKMTTHAKRKKHAPLAVADSGPDAFARYGQRTTAPPGAATDSRPAGRAVVR